MNSVEVRGGNDLALPPDDDVLPQEADVIISKNGDEVVLHNIKK